MQRSLVMNMLLLFLLACLASSCHAGTTSYTRSWSSSVTTRTSTKSTTRRVAQPHIPKNRASRSATCPLKSSAANAAIKKVGHGANDNNCVLFLRRQRGIDLPAKNLTTYAAKLSIINSRSPREHSVAIIKTPGRNAGIGHLAEVTGLERKDGRVTMRLTEANNPRRGYYERTITGKNVEEVQKKANIVGYYVEPDATINAQSTSGSRYF